MFALTCQLTQQLSYKISSQTSTIATCIVTQGSFMVYSNRTLLHIHEWYLTKTLPYINISQSCNVARYVSLLRCELRYADPEHKTYRMTCGNSQLNIVRRMSFLGNHPNQETYWTLLMRYQINTVKDLPDTVHRIINDATDIKICRTNETAAT